MDFQVLFFFLFKCIQVVTSLRSIAKEIEAVIGLTTVEMIIKLGYPIEVHTVQTKDGYILDLHRIPHGKNNKTRKHASPVLMYPGVFADSACYACWAPESSLAYILADRGYDVWLGNTRGTTHCKKHVKLDPYKDKKKFWNFSFQEMATYDVPESIDYILNITNSENLYYIGHSQGSTIAFAMLAETPIYNDKIRLLITLAPIVNTKHSSIPALKIVVNDFPYYKSIIDKYELYEVLPYSKQFQRRSLSMCNNNSTMQDFCLRVMCSFLGCTYEIANKKYFPLLLSNLPAGASMKQLVHYMQLLEGEFKKYDYGNEKNLKIYNSELAPIYNLSNIRIQTALFYGTADILSAHQDVEILARKIPRIIYKKRIENFNHIDLLYATDVNNLVNMDIVNLLIKY